jgi:CheY-like chemotaxis protein
MSKLERQHSIFVVDDEPVIASTLGEILRRQGLDVTPFTDPFQALQAIQTKAPDFLRAEVVMPGMSGIELAIVIRETPDCTVERKWIADDHRKGIVPGEDLPNPEL